MKHLEKISRPKQKKPTYLPRGQIGKIITLSLIGAGVYLLISRQKVFAEEAPEEYTPSEKPQDQLTKELYEQLPPSTVVERATEIADTLVKEATEEANIKIQQVKEETEKTIAEITKKANEELDALKAKMETAYQLNLEDLVQEYRARDEVVRAETEQKIQVARIEADQAVQAARIEADQKIQAARIEADQKVQAERIEAARIEAERKPILLSSTLHTYIGVTNGSGKLSIDGDFSTFQGEGVIGQDLGNGDFTRKCISQHTWDKPRTITSITYRMRTQAATAGVQNDSFEYDQKIEYTIDGFNWLLVPGTQKHRSGGPNTCYGGSACIIAQDATISVNLTGCKGIRAYTYTHVTENDGHLWAGNEIYEIQATATP